MLTITTIYFAHLEPTRDPVSGKTIPKELSDLENAERKVVVVYAGSGSVPSKDIETRE
jgi:hypothetical protein